MKSIIFQKETILGYPIITDNKKCCIEKTVQWINKDNTQKCFFCANPHSLEIANRDIVFKKALQTADMLTPDGIGIVLASKMLGGKIKNRITGSDIFQGVSDSLNKETFKRKSYFFLGSTEETLAAIKSRINMEYPNITIAGFYSPPFKSQFTEKDNRLMIEAVNVSKADILWVGMTAPKQEKWILQNKDKINVKFVGAIGAVFDFYAGNVQRSHPWFQKHGLEWLPRLIQEPRRLWYRNFVSNPIFMLRVIVARLKGKKAIQVNNSEN